MMKAFANWKIPVVTCQRVAHQSLASHRFCVPIDNEASEEVSDYNLDSYQKVEPVLFRSI